MMTVRVDDIMTNMSLTDFTILHILLTTNDKLNYSELRKEIVNMGVSISSQTYRFRIASLEKRGLIVKEVFTMVNEKNPNEGTIKFAYSATDAGASCYNKNKEYLSALLSCGYQTTNAG